MIVAQLNSGKGQVTLQLTGLNRAALMERRQEAISGLMHVAQRVAREAEGPLKELLKQEVRLEVTGNREFAMVKRGVLRALGLLP